MMKRTIRAAEIIEDVRSGMSDARVQEKYGLGPDALQYVLHRAVEAGLMEHVELYERTTLSEPDRIRAFDAQRDQVLRCRVCGNLLSDRHRACPHCERLEEELKHVLVMASGEAESELTTMQVPAAYGAPKRLTASEHPHDRDAVRNVTRVNGEEEFWPGDRRPATAWPSGPLEVASWAAELEIQENSRRRALLKAAGKGRVEAVRALLHDGVDVNSQSKSGHTPLMGAAFKGQIEVMEVLLERGADVHMLNSQGNSALWFACLACDEIAVELLLDNGADPWARNTDGNTALMVACAEDRTDIVRILLKNGDLANRANNAGETPLMKASEKGYQQLVELLLQAQSHVDAKNNYGNTALMKAAFRGHSGVVTLLLHAGADPNARNTYGNTALMKACFHGHFSVAKLLLEAGADVSAEDNEGKTAIMRGALSGNQQLLDLLTLYSNKKLKSRTRES